MNHMKPGQAYCASLAGAILFFIVGLGVPSSAMKQLGTVGLVATILSTPVLFLKPTTQANVARKTKRYAVGICVFTLFFFATGEVALRLWFWNGLSFSSRFGPIVEHFERHFEFNRYDGRSRGPEIAGPRKPNSVRILVQGDSITWGQGIQCEQELFTNRLLMMLRRDNPDTEMAVLAKPGREIDGHLIQIAKWGEEIDPDIIIYQWFVNDVEIDKKSLKPNRRVWRRLFFHQTLVRHSYFWFFLDYNLNRVLPTKKQSYRDYMLEHFSSDTSEWKRFVSVFHVWAREAKRITPKVLIILYPHLNSQGRPILLTIYNRFVDLCEEQGFEVLDLWHSFGDLQGDLGRIKASIYDAHPSAEVHQRIAEGIYNKLKYGHFFSDGSLPDLSGVFATDHICSVFTGSVPIHFPVEANTALVVAGATGGTSTSPRPPGGTIYTSTFGISSILSSFYP